jgi:hypothetical protein
LRKLECFFFVCFLGLGWTIDRVGNLDPGGIEIGNLVLIFIVVSQDEGILIPYLST